MLQECFQFIYQNLEDNFSKKKMEGWKNIFSQKIEFFLETFQNFEKVNERSLLI